LRHYLVDDVDGNREAYPGRSARTRQDCRVDTDQASGRIEKRAAGITRVDRGIGLDDPRDFAPARGRHTAARGADNAGRQRAVEAERIADGVNPLADAQVRGLPEGDRAQAFWHFVELEHGEIVIGRAADDLGRDRIALVEFYGNGVRTFDDVVVGDDMAKRIPDEPGTGARRLQVFRRRQFAFGNFCGEYVGDARCGFREQADVETFFGGQGAARRHAAWLVSGSEGRRDDAGKKSGDDEKCGRFFHYRLPMKLHRGRRFRRPRWQWTRLR
jgi:hypothetical protein